MKKSLQSRLKTYSSVAAGVLVASSAGAQIVYTDVNPDVTLNTFPNSYNIDMDGNTITDFSLALYSTSISTFHKNQVFFNPAVSTNSFITSNSYVGVLNLNSAIGPTGSFENLGFHRNMASFYSFTGGGNTYSYTKGNWTGSNTDKYIGVKFDISGSAHYGWIRLDASLAIPYNGAWSVTIKDFAYNSVAGASILAGDMGGTTGITEEFQTVQAYSFNKNINININKSDYANAQINVYNNLGQIVHTQEATQQKEVVDMSSHAMGVYYVKVQSDKGMISRKVFLK
jgi:Secretion system C-terminal sorting domain